MSVYCEGYNGQFQYNLFEIQARHSRKPFLAHRDILAKLRKLEKKCNSNFVEAKNKMIKLPYDDPKIFALLLEFLYHSDYWPFFGEEFGAYRSEDEDIRAIQLQREGDLYCVAVYYQLDDLQRFEDGQ